MRILVVCQYFWPESFRINDLSAKLVSLGHEVEVFTGLPNYPKGQFFKGYSFAGPYTEDKNGIRIKRVPLIPRFSGKGWQLALNYLSFLVSGSIGIFLRAKRPDAILVYQLSPVTQAIPAILFGFVTRTPVLFYVQDLWPDSLVATGATENSAILGFFKVLVKWLYRSSHLVLVQSRAFATAIGKYGVAQENIRYLPNTAEDFYQPVAPTAQNNLMPKVPAGFRILFAGNIGKAQDFGTILSAAEQLKKHPEIHFVVAGDGREREWMQIEIAKRGLSETFHWVGSHSPQSMPGLFAHADCMLVTLKDEPPFAQTIPSKVQSYMACEKPIIASIRGEGAQVVQESGSGMTCEPEKPEVLAALIYKMSRLSSDERRSMGRKGREYFEREFSGNTVVKRLESWIQEVSRR